jgi:hypothetical protein
MALKTNELLILNLSKTLFLIKWENLQILGVFMLLDIFIKQFEERLMFHWMIVFQCLQFVIVGTI